MGFLKNFVLIFSLRCVQLVLCNEGSDSGPIFQTSLGKIQGSVMTTDGGIEFFAFRGIPFAKPPVKELRFKEPQALTEHWAEVWDATEDGTICIQYDILHKALTGDEDCLYLNVYTPKFEDQAFADALPVMVWIHGGAFVSGSGTSSHFGPQRLMDKTGIILVTINYRLGPFGFLTTLDEHSPGNYGMLDQVQALKWVKGNIAAFGGDPGKVTIFGESAGGGSVGLHLLSPVSRGYFHAAISQSGSALSDWVTHFDNRKALNDAKTLASKLRCPTENHKAMIKCLTRLPSLDIVLKSAKLVDENIQTNCNLIFFQPVVDVTRGSKAFLPDYPINLVPSMPLNGVPIMTGVTKDEGILFIDLCTEGPGGIASHPKSHLPTILKSYAPSLFKNEEQWKRVSQKMISPYFNNVADTDTAKKIAALNEFMADSFINFKVDLLNDLFTKSGRKVYVYKFSYRGENSICENAPNYMVAHADELQYLFRCYYFKSTTLSEEDSQMSDIILTLWTSFAKTKVPSLEKSFTEQPGFQWEPMTSNNLKYLNLNLTPTMVHGHLSVNYNLWKDAYSGHRQDEL